MSKKELMDDGENRAVRAFLLLYGGQSGVSTNTMRLHLRMSGFDGFWPEWANQDMHLTKAGAQLWIKHLFALEQLDSITIQEAWDAVGGNPDLKATKQDLLDVLHVLSDKDDEEERKDKAANKTLEGIGYTYHGEELWKPPTGNAPQLQAEQPAQQEPDIAALVKGMEVSVDVSIGDHDSGHRFFGTVTMVQESQGSKHGFILLVQEPQANFTAPPQRQPLTDEEMEIEWQFLHDEEGNPPDHHDFGRAIEARHGINGKGGDA